MAKNGFRVFDSDLHVFEPADLYEHYLEAKFKHQAPTTTPSKHGGYRPAGWQVGEYSFPRAIGNGRKDAEARSREVLKPYEAQQFNPASQLQAMGVEGIDVAVLFRTLPVICIDDLEATFVTALCRAWNDWVTDFRALDPEHMHAAALLTLHDPALAAEELRRCVEDLGMVAAQMAPNPVNSRHLHDPSCDVLWAEAERLDVPICFHPAPNNYGNDHFVNRYLSSPSTTMAITLNNPVELMAAVASMTAGGVLQRFPALRVAFLEGNCSWLPWLLWRLDELYEMSKAGETAQLDQDPSAYFMRQCFISIEPDEHLAKHVVQELGDDILVFSTDYPHSDSRFPDSTDCLLNLELSDATKTKILWDNCTRLYGSRVGSALVG
ncbi:MAG: amidohydrolase family protein [bacterium]|nr:amidohydrolase family protein [bacterium]